MSGIFCIDSIDYLYRASIILIRTMCVECDIKREHNSNSHERPTFFYSVTVVHGSVSKIHRVLVSQGRLNAGE